MRPTDPLAVKIILVGLQVAAKSLEATDKVVQKLPLVSRARALALDILLSPEEASDYVSVTSPRTTSTP